MADENKEKLRILVKFPTRERPQKFKEVIDRYIMMAKDNDNIHYLISLDSNDPKLQQYLDFLKDMRCNITIVTDFSTGKIHACNRDIGRIKVWDIVLLASDDMICQRVGWDETLRQEMEQYYPDLDGVLWHNDVYLQKRLNTMCILGRKRFAKFNYIYNPEYTSLWCDNEFMEVADKDCKQTYFDECLFKHEHYSHGPHNHHTVDELLKRNEKFFQRDKTVYERRKREGFPINRAKLVR